MGGWRHQLYYHSLAKKKKGKKTMCGAEMRSELPHYAPNFLHGSQPSLFIFGEWIVWKLYFLLV